jgi:hypothetical protein
MERKERGGAVNDLSGKARVDTNEHIRIRVGDASRLGGCVICQRGMVVVSGTVIDIIIGKKQLRLCAGHAVKLQKILNDTISSLV